MVKPTYLGDGVIAEYDGYHVILSIDEQSTKIYLDSSVITSLLAYLEVIRLDSLPVTSDVPPLNPPVQS